MFTIDVFLFPLVTENYNMRKMFIEIDSMTENEKALLKSIWSDVLELQCKDMKYISSVYDTLIERYPYGPQRYLRHFSIIIIF